MIATLIKRVTEGGRTLVVTHCPGLESSDAPSVALLSLFAEDHLVAGSFMTSGDCLAIADALQQAASLIDADEAQREQRKAAEAAKPTDTSNAKFRFEFDDTFEVYTLADLQRLSPHRTDMLAWAAQARPHQRHDGTLLRRVA